ncbi:hypothetical protein NKG94_48360 [Micromonospora sp. M12]
MPFTDDGLRDGEHLRAWMTERFRVELAGSGVPVVELTGPHSERLARAVLACDDLLAAGWSLTDPLTDQLATRRPTSSPTRKPAHSRHRIRTSLLGCLAG